MASPRYTWNLPPEAPEEPKHEMTAKEKRENFWFYYKWHVLGGLFAVLLVIAFVWEIVSQVHPDYTIGVLTTSGFPSGAGEELSKALTPYFDDRNGDGEVVVSVLEYAFAADPGTAADPTMQMASMTRLSGDLDSGDSMLFLTDDVPFFQEQFGFFAYNDGTSPQEGAAPDYTRMGVRWADCPALTGLEMTDLPLMGSDITMPMQEMMAGYTLVPRIITGSKLEGDKDAQAYFQSAMNVFYQLTDTTEKEAS